MFYVDSYVLTRHSQYAALRNHDLSCRNVAVLACRLGRADVVRDIFRWYDLRRPVTMRAITHAAIALDDGVLVSALFCRSAQQRKSPPSRKQQVAASMFFYDALAMAASDGRTDVMRCLMDKGKRDSMTQLRECLATQDTLQEHDLVSHRGCAFAASTIDRRTSLESDWVPYAAAHNRTDVFVQATAKGWTYGPFHAMGHAVVHGSTDVADFVALENNPAHLNSSQWAQAIADLVLCRRYYGIITAAVGLTRGMAWLRAHDMTLTLDDIVYMVCRLDEHPALAECVLNVWMDLPDPSALSFLQPRVLRDIIRRGKWSLLSRVIIACGRSDDNARVAGEQPIPRAWWAEITKHMAVAHTVNGFCLLKSGEKATRALSMAYHIACLCGRIPSAAAKVLDDLVPAQALGNVDADFEPACWARWCNPVPLRAHDSTYSTDEASDKETRRRATHMLNLLFDAGLIVVDKRDTTLQEESLPPAQRPSKRKHASPRIAN